MIVMVQLTKYYLSADADRRHAAWPNRSRSHRIKLTKQAELLFKKYIWTFKSRLGELFPLGRTGSEGQGIQNVVADGDGHVAGAD